MNAKAYRVQEDVHIYQSPTDIDQYQSKYWSIADAASAWGCTYFAARRWMRAHPECTVLTHRYNSRGLRHCWVVPVGTVKTASMVGNPNFKNTDFQRDMARRRWLTEDRKHMADAAHPRAAVDAAPEVVPPAMPLTHITTIGSTAMGVHRRR